MLRKLLIIAALALVPSIAAADPPPREPLVFVADPKLGVETSVRSLDSLGRLLFRYEDVLPQITIDDHATPGKILAFIGRGARLLFFDEPIAEISTTATHEVAGHGARGRELGLQPTFVFHLPGIYRLLFAPRDNDGVGAVTSFQTPNIIEEPREILGTLGGVEAQYTQAWWINARIVRSDGWVHHGDMLAYGASKVAYMESFFAPSTRMRGAVSGSNDVSSYVTSLQEFSNGWRSEDRSRIARRLAASYVWNLVDPTLMYSIYGGLIAPLWRGARTTQMPLPRIGETIVFPSPRFNLTPFGSEQMLDVFLARCRGRVREPGEGSRRDCRLLNVYGRIGTSGLASYWGAGARVLGVEVARRVTLGAELDLWRQPEILLNVRAAFDSPNRLGMNAGVYADVRITGDVSLTGKLAAKTPGYVMAQPIAGGPHGYIGVSLAWR